MISVVSDPLELLPLFRRLPYSLVPMAAANGIANGVFYAIDGEQAGQIAPIAVLWDTAHGLYIAGSAGLGDTNRHELGRLLTTEIIPAARPPGFIVYSDDTTGDEVVKSLPPDRKVIRDSRVIFRLVASSVPPPDSTTEYEFVPVSGEFFRRTDLSGRETLDDWLAECWKSLGDYVESGFGVAALRGSEVVGWCMAEYVGSGEVGIGIETAPSCRGRGLGTLLARRFVAMATERRLSARWDSWARNRASVAIAERLGYSERTEYCVHWVVV